MSIVFDFFSSNLIDTGSGGGVSAGMPITGADHNAILVTDSSGNLADKVLTNGQLLIGSTGASPVAATLTGTSNQVTVTPGAGNITLSLPQNIATTSSPTFASITATSTISASNFSGSSSGTNTGDVTITTGNGLSVLGQALSLSTSSSSTTGSLTSTDWSTFNGKQTALGFTPENSANKGVANGYAQLDANILLPISIIPPAALERLVIVANQTARYALTTATVQNGDTVQQVDTGTMYFVKDDTNLGNSAGYSIYTAGTASAVAWSGITSIPSAVSSLSGTNTGDVTITTGNGLSVIGQALSLGTSSTSTTGTLTSTDWNTFNNKQNAITTLPIANGGTNASSYTAPSGNIKPIIFFDGTRFATDGTVADLGYDTVTDTFYSGAIVISGATTGTAKFTNTAAQGSSAGAGMSGFSDPGAAMLSGSRLGFYTLGGSVNASHTTSNATAISSFATENWSTSATGSNLILETTANGGTVRAAALTLGQDKSATFASTVSAIAFTSTIATGTAPFTVTSTTQVANLNAATAGSASTATTATNSTNAVTTTKSDNTNYYLTFVGANSSSNQGIDVGPATYNPSTSTITATTFVGTLTGNASTATNATTVTTNANLTGPITSTGNATAIADGAIATTKLAVTSTSVVYGDSTGFAGVDAVFTFNDTTKTLNATHMTATDFTGALIGNASTATSATTAGSATTATTATNSTNAATTTKSDNVTYYPTFVGANSSSNQGIDVGPMTYNPSTNTLTATTFVGALTGNVTGNVSGSSGSTTGNAATVTTNANLTGPITSTGNATSIADGAIATTKLAVTSTSVVYGNSTGFAGVDAAFTFNDTTKTLNATHITGTDFTGAVVGTASGNTTRAAVASSTSLTAASSITPSLTKDFQTIRVASSSGAIALSTTVPFGSSAPLDGAQIIVIGTSDANSVQFTNSDTAKGCLLVGNCTLVKGSVITFMYTATDDRYWEVSRNF